MYHAVLVVLLANVYTLPPVPSILRLNLVLEVFFTVILMWVIWSSVFLFFFSFTPPLHQWSCGQQMTYFCILLSGECLNASPNSDFYKTLLCFGGCRASQVCSVVWHQVAQLSMKKQTDNWILMKVKQQSVQVLNLYHMHSAHVGKFVSKQGIQIFSIQIFSTRVILTQNWLEWEKDCHWSMQSCY